MLLDSRQGGINRSERNVCRMTLYIKVSYSVSRSARNRAQGGREGAAAGRAACQEG